MLNSGVEKTNGSEANARTRRFGVFELDLRAGELRRNGLRVKLQEQPFQVLALLLETPGEVVTRDDLRARLWQADTFVDFDHSLNAAIKRLRVALGDSAENPVFVETVARRGYRFLAPVSTVANGNGALELVPAIDSSSGIQVAQPTAPAAADFPLRLPPGFHLWWIFAGAASVILILLGIKLGLMLAQRHSAAQVSAAVRVTRLTANPAEDRVRAAAISRDGKYLAFSDETGFYLRQIDTGETHPLALPAGLSAGSISWFPDSAHLIASLSGPSQRSSLWEISTLGGNPRKLIDNGRFPEVSPDGKQIAYITGLRLGNQIWLAAANGEQPYRLLGEEGDFFGSVAWSPDSTRLAYIRGRLTNAYGLSGVIEYVNVSGRQRLVNVADRQANVLYQLNGMGWFSAISGPLSWASDGRLIYAQDEPPPRQLDSNLWSISFDPGGHPTSSPLRLTNDAGSVSSISVSADGKRIVYVKGEPQPDVYTARLDAHGAITPPARLTLDDRQDLPFDWTADGKAVIFISDRTGMFSIYRQAPGQPIPELLVGGGQPVITPRISADGTQLLYLVYPDWTGKASAVSLMRMPLAGGAPQQVLAAGFISNQQCARAPATLCLYSIEADNTFTLMSFDPLRGNGSLVYQIEDEFAQAYNWSLSPDGTMLAIAKGKIGAEESRIRLITLRTVEEKSGEEKPGEGKINELKFGEDKWLPVEGATGISTIDWAADSKSLWATTGGDEENALLNVDLQGHARVVWQPKKLWVHWAIPSRDGKSLALHVASSSANAWMVERP
jgi:DNA-binding winged helix-turn-helix (wHTH) protein/Tol biopolymer transport system component